VDAVRGENGSGKGTLVEAPAADYRGDLGASGSSRGWGASPPAKVTGAVEDMALG
jgi:predicted ATPase